MSEEPLHFGRPILPCSVAGTDHIITMDLHASQIQVLVFDHFNSGFSYYPVFPEICAPQKVLVVESTVDSSVADPRHFGTDPDADPDPQIRTSD